MLIDIANLWMCGFTSARASAWLQYLLSLHDDRFVAVLRGKNVTASRAISSLCLRRFTGRKVCDTFPAARVFNVWGRVFERDSPTAQRCIRSQVGEKLLFRKSGPWDGTCDAAGEGIAAPWRISACASTAADAGPPSCQPASGLLPPSAPDAANPSKYTGRDRSPRPPRFECRKATPARAGPHPI